MSLPLVSIIIPVYNTGILAKKLVKDILGFNYNDLEIILVDDGSTDDSLAQLKTTKDKRVKVYSKKNGGPSSARNYGIDKSSGEFLLFVDSDDEIKKDFIVKLVEEIKKDNTALAMTGVRFKNLNNGTEKDEYLSNFPRKNRDLKTYILASLLRDGRMYPAFNKIFKADIIRKNKIKFDENMDFGEDTKFVLSYLREAKGEIRAVLSPLYIYHENTETSISSKAEGKWDNWKKGYINLKKWVGRPNLKQRWLLAMIYIRWRYSWLRAK